MPAPLTQRAGEGAAAWPARPGVRSGRADGRRLLILVLCLLAVGTGVGAADAAGSVRQWLDRAADPRASRRERDHAARQILMLADSSASILLAALRDEESGLRQQVAARLLGRIAPAGAEAPLVTAALGREYFLAEAAGAALEELYARRDDEELARLLARGRPERGGADAEAGADDGIGADDWLALSIDAARLRGRYRALVLRGLARKYETSGAVMPPGLTALVWDGLLDADPDGRRQAVRAAAVSRNSQAGGKVAALLYTENDPKVITAGLRAMAAMRPPDYGAAVERHVAHADAAVALEALAALDAMGYAGLLVPGAGAARGRTVAGFVSHPATPVRRRAIELLVASKNPAVLEYLQPALFDRVAANRAAAAAGLGELGFTAAVGWLLPHLRDG
ncbi:MAG: HEAT repeat domain-containing protein, partial [Planctomycetes bacterium]|nr:HEAT repeat domain-containing protein [Planctomycetota bacterium]